MLFFSIKFKFQSAAVTLKLGQGHQNLITFSPCANDVSAGLVKF